MKQIYIQRRKKTSTGHNFSVIDYVGTKTFEDNFYVAEKNADKALDKLIKELRRLRYTNIMMSPTLDYPG